MTTEELKKAAAAAAITHIKADMIVGVGTGSTTNHFIDLLATIKGKIEGTVASSEASAKRLRDHGIPVLDLNAVGELPIYVDGADEATCHHHLIKGGGGALTREKILAQASKTFLCIIDHTKLVDVLGEFPLPVEVIPMARSLVARHLVGLGGRPQLRQDCVTDNGNIILDVYHLSIIDPVQLESDINQIPGVVSVGIFARRPADKLIISNAEGVQVL